MVTFFFDFISPYAYLAWWRVLEIADRHGRELEPVPVLFAGLLQAHGTRGPAEVPARRRYLMKDVVRIAHDFAVPIDAPFAHPFNPLLALRLSSLPMSPRERRALISALFRATWAERRAVVEPAVVAEILAAAGLPRELLGRAAEPDAKQRVREQTERAIALGVFGVPTAAVGAELFWGTDSLPHLERFLSGADPVPVDLLERWAALPAQAVRRS